MVSGCGHHLTTPIISAGIRQMASQEKRTFDKYLKFVTQKAAQVIVKARQGDKTRTTSQPTKTEWFNVALPDMKEVLTQLREHVDPAYPQDGQPVCVEISVDTPECEPCVLEQWTLSLDTSKRDVSVSISHGLYPRLSLMLKSLVAVTRTTPAYQMARKSEDLHFSYQIHSNSESSLPPEFTSVTFAQTSCPYGTVAMSVHYRKRFVLQERKPVVPSSHQLSHQTSHHSSSSSEDSVRQQHALQPPFAMGAQLTQPAATGSGRREPFAGILPRPNEEYPRSDSNSTGQSEDSSIVRADRQDSNELQSVTVTSGRDGYLVLDLERVEPVFGDNDSDGGATLLQLCSDPPSLDVFTAEGSMDITTAMNLIDTQTPLETC